MRRLPPLGALPAFEAVARLGSVTAAAEELGRTQGAVSKKLKALGEDIGAPLFERDGGGLRLTPAGARFRDAVADALDRIAAARRDAISGAAAPALAVGLSATFAMRWLTPRLSGFYERHPGAEVQLYMAGRAELRDVDLVVTYDRLEFALSQERTLRSIGDVDFGVVAAPGYALEPTARGVRVAERIEVDRPSSRRWDRWAELSGVAVEAEKHTSYPHTFLGIEAARAGLGVALVERRLVERDLADGGLTAPLGWRRIEGGLGVVLPGLRAPHPLFEPFLAWLEEAARDDGSSSAPVR